MSDWLPISTVSGSDLGWIKPELVVSVSPGSGQRIIEYRDGDRIRTAQRKFGFDDDEFMRRLGLDLATDHQRGTA